MAGKGKGGSGGGGPTGTWLSKGPGAPKSGGNPGMKGNGKGLARGKGGR